MTDLDINQKIADWVGLDSHICDEWAFHCDDCARGSIQTPDYYNTNSAFDILDVLVERGYRYNITGYDTVEVLIGKQAKTLSKGNFVIKGHTSNKSISVAVCEAIIQLIKKDNL